MAENRVTNRAKQLANGDWEADVVIVGSGIVGAMMATEISAKGHSVLLLDAGLRVERGQIVENSRNMPEKNRAGIDYQSLYPQSPNAPFPDYFPDNGYLKLSGPNAAAYAQDYLKTVGGTTWHWAASCWRHAPHDFKMKSLYGVGRDWPITYDDLEPYYTRAEYEIGVAGPRDPKMQSPPERSKPYPMEMIPWSYFERSVAATTNAFGCHLVPIPQGRSSRVWEERPVCCGNNNCMPICPIGAMYNGIHHVVRAERNGTTVLSETVVYRVDNDENNRITAIHYYDRDKKSHKVSGKRFVFACNGIETPRLLLLAANESNPNGIANNSSGLVGKNMMDHSGIHCSFQSKDPLWVGRGPAQSAAMVGYRDGSFRRDHAAFLIIMNNLNRNLAETQVALEKGYEGKELQREIRERTTHSVYWDIMLEVLPSEENRLTLSKTRKDALGLACPDIYYDVGDYTRRGRIAAQEKLREIAALFKGQEVVVTTEFVPNNHIMGGNIMGDTPQNGVVNSYCRTYDHDNLWLPGGGAMPSSSVVNSTLSMAALGLRAADDLLKSME